MNARNIKKESWMGMLITNYAKILNSPKYHTETLDKANDIITEALTKIEQVIKDADRKAC
jgi:hypothetical protein